MNATEIIVLILGALVGAINISMIWSLFSFWKDVDKKIDNLKQKQDDEIKQLKDKVALTEKLLEVENERINNLYRIAALDGEIFKRIVTEVNQNKNS